MVREPVLRRGPDALRCQSRLSHARSDLCASLHVHIQKFNPHAADPGCSRCPAGWRWWRERCYFFSVGLWENLSWNESAEFCRRHDSSLVVFEDPVEMEMVTSIRRTTGECNDMIHQTLILHQDFLQCVMMKFPTFPFLWVGLTDAKQEGHWVWMDGSDLQRYVP